MHTFDPFFLTLGWLCLFLVFLVVILSYTLLLSVRMVVLTYLQALQTTLAELCRLSYAIGQLDLSFSRTQ